MQRMNQTQAGQCGWPLAAACAGTGAGRLVVPPVLAATNAAAGPHSKCQPLAAMHFLILRGRSSMAASTLASLMACSRKEHCSSHDMRRRSIARSSFRCAGPNTP